MCLEVMDVCQLVFAGLSEDFVLRKGSGAVVCPAGAPTWSLEHTLSPGTHTVTWNALCHLERTLSPGTHTVTSPPPDPP